MHRAAIPDSVMRIEYDRLQLLIESWSSFERRLGMHRVKQSADWLSGSPAFKGNAVLQSMNTGT